VNIKQIVLRIPAKRICQIDKTMNAKHTIALAILIFMFVPFVFAEEFQNRPTLSGLNETANQATVCGNAVIERDTVVSRNQNFFPYCGHGQSYFASLQHELQEHLATLYIDHVNGPLNPEGTAFLYLTLATWREAAELNEDGFQRFDSDGNFIGYGIAQSNDGILPTVFDELQSGFGALKWKAGTLNWISPGESKTGAASIRWFYGPEEKAATIAAAETAFDVSSGAAANPYAGTLKTLDWEAYCGYSMFRSKGTPTCGAVIIPHSVVLYVRGRLPVGYIGPDPVYDDNGDGISESSSFSVHETSGEETGTTWTGSVIGGVARPTWCIDVPGDYPDFGYIARYRGYECLGIILLKYNFTNE